METEPVYQHPPDASSTPPAASGTPPSGGNASAPANCETAFAGVTFALAHAAGASRSPGASFRFVADRSGNAVVLLNALGPVTYAPTVTITATGATVATDFEAGLIQNVLSGNRRATYSTGVSVITAPSTAPPLKDGAPSSSGMYDTDFAENGGGHPNILGSFTTSGSSVSLVLPDAPANPAWLELTTDPAFHPPWASAQLTRSVQKDTFRTWVGVRHKPTGCVHTIHHIDWNTDWDLAVTVPPMGAAPSAAWTTNASNVTETNGSGSPSYIRGGPVPADGITREVKG